MLSILWTPLIQSASPGVRSGETSGVGLPLCESGVGVGVGVGVSVSGGGAVERFTGVCGSRSSALWLLHAVRAAAKKMDKIQFLIALDFLI
jgi:hypothetical protein